MTEQDIRGLIADVKRGRVSRRAFVQTLVALGLTAPMAGQMLASSGVAHAQSKGPAFTPTRRGGGGQLKVLWWQAPTLLNPHFATGTKDNDASRIFYEPLAAYDPDGNVIPVLAERAPTVDNGDLAKDGMSVTWRLKKGVQWHDGKPFTADDVVFTWEYASDPATAAVSIGQILPKHLFDAYRGAKSREAPNNLKPVGTGPFRFLDFKPGDTVRGEINANYHVAHRPFFDSIEMKGGGDAVSAARAVLQTGEYDYAWNLQVEDDILKRLEQGGKGRVEIWQTGNPEHIQFNFTDPGKEIDGERSSLKSTHPLLSDPAVRQALALLLDRSAVHEEIYGRGGQTTANFLNAPSRFRSSAMRWEFSIDKANAILDAAGWKRGADGIRVKDGKRLKLLFQTATNAPRQKTQQIYKQACARAGIDVELKHVVASVFFASDPANPDTYPHFYADLQMYNTTMGAPDPQRFMEAFTSWQAAAKENKWSGRNITRFRNEECDRLWKTAEQEMDPAKRAAAFIRMNDIVISNHVVMTVLQRNGVAGANLRLRGMDLTPWDSTMWRLPYWHKA